MSVFFKYFNGRSYTDSQTYLIITQENKKSRIFSFDSKKWRDFMVKIRKESPAYIRNKPTIADQGEVDKNFAEVNKKLTELEARPIGTQIMDGTELVKTVKKSDIIFADDEVIINGGEA